MKFDLEQYVEALLPWDFVVTVGGKDYPTRPLLLGDVLLMEQFNANGGSVAKLAEFTRSLFEGESPDVAGWRMEAFTGLLTKLMGYWAERAKKNAEAAGKASTGAATS